MSKAVWRLVAAQHGVVSHEQLLGVGLGEAAIRHRMAKGRLHAVRRGVYAVGRPELTQHGRWMAAVLACGPGALLSHLSAAALWGFGGERGRIDVSVPATCRPRHAGIAAHRRHLLTREDRARYRGVPATSPVRTLVDVAAQLSSASLERAVNEVDRLDLVDPEALRAALGAYRGGRGVARLRTLLDRRTLRLTRSELERLFLPLTEQAGLPLPLTKQGLNGFEVDFLWPDLRLVVETDGLRYHRTPAQQTRDRVRDQAHLAAGFTPLRFTHAQVRYEPEHVRATLRSVARRLRGARAA